MLDDAPEVLKEMPIGLAWPVHGPINWLAKPWGGLGSGEWVKAIELVAIVAGVTAIFFEVSYRQEERDARAEERLARMWGLATDPRPGNSGKIPALEFLNKLGEPLSGISIPKAYLREVDLSGADLDRADLSAANLTKANLSGVKYLTQARLDEACIDVGRPPRNLPDGLKPPTNICP